MWYSDLYCISETILIQHFKFIIFNMKNIQLNLFTTFV